MVDASIEHLESRLRWHLRHFLSDDAPAKNGRRFMLRELRDLGWPAVLFGGMLRDIMELGAWTQLRDVDIVVGGVSNDQLQSRFKAYIRRKTRFGGFNLGVDGHLFDIWSLPDTWAFREFPVLLKGDFADLPRTTFLTAEAVAVELHVQPGQPRTVFHHRFFESILDRVVELNFAENPDPGMSIIRAFVTAQKLRFGIGPSLARYISHFGTQFTPEELFELQVSHYRRAFFSVSEIARLLDLIVAHTRWHGRRAISIPAPRQLCLF